MSIQLLNNPILWTDGYKPSHWKQTPENTTRLYDHWMSRGGKYGEIVPFGMQYYVSQYLSQAITMADVVEAYEFFADYFNDDTVFNRKGFETLVTQYGGVWPVKIKFAPEGLPVKTRNVLMTVENTAKSDAMAWVVGYLETLLSLVWYPTTVATHSREIKKVLAASLERTGTPSLIDWMLHDFGMRGVSSIESGGIGGAAHLVNFKGSDTLSGVVVARKVYGERMAAGSIPAMEHRTVTIWTEPKEFEAYNNMIKQYGNNKSGLYAIVLDSYDPDGAINILGEQLKNRVISAASILVGRPDSGIPHESVTRVLEGFDRHFGHTVNAKGFKVLNHSKVLQGDGLTEVKDFETIIAAQETRGWSQDSYSFGMGGGLLQKMDRDTQKFAMKASNATVDGRERDFRKNPSTDSGKTSLSGRLKLVRNGDGELVTVPYSTPGHDVLETVFDGGVIAQPTSLATIRARAKLDE